MDNKTEERIIKIGKGILTAAVAIIFGKRGYDKWHNSQNNQQSA